MSAVKSILLIYIACGILYVGLLSMSVIDTDAGNPIVNVLYYVFIPVVILYGLLLSLYYGIVGPPTGTL